MVYGVVNFIGTRNKEVYNTKTKQWSKTNEKEFVITLRNPVFMSSAIDKCKDFYVESANKPKWYDALIEKGQAPEYITFKSDLKYAPQWVTIKKGSLIEKKMLNEIEMNEAEIVMIYRGPYIGAIRVLKEGKPFDAFESFDFEALPFN